MVSFCLFVLDLATARVESICCTALHRNASHARDRWEFRDPCFVLDQTEAEERKKECSLPICPPSLRKIRNCSSFFFFFLATKSQVGGRQREKLVANGDLATGNFEQKDSFLHILFIDKYTHAPHSSTSHCKLPTKLGPVSFSLYCTL